MCSSWTVFSPNICPLDALSHLMLRPVLLCSYSCVFQDILFCRASRNSICFLKISYPRNHFANYLNISHLIFRWLFYFCFIVYLTQSYLQTPDWLSRQRVKAVTVFAVVPCGEASTVSTVLPCGDLGFLCLLYSTFL